MIHDYADMMAKAMLGEHAVQTSLNFIRQKIDNENKKAVIIGQETKGKLAFGSDMSHILVMGDMIFRPHVIIESNHFEGEGIAFLAQSGFDLDRWVRNGNVLLDQVCRTKPKMDKPIPKF